MTRHLTLLPLLALTLWGQAEDRIVSTSAVVFAAYKDGNDVKFSSRAGAVIIDKTHVVTSLSGCCAKTQSGAQTVPGIYAGGKIQVAKVLWSSEELDIAILEGPMEGSDSRPPALLAPSNTMREGQAVFTALFGDIDKPPHISAGAIQGTAKMDSGAVLYKTSAGLEKGNDGGGLFDACGNVVGATYTLKEGVTYVVPADTLLQGLQAAGVQASAATQPCNGASVGAGGGGKSSGGGGTGGGGGGGATKGKPKEEEPEDDPGRWRLPRGTEWVPVILLVGILVLAFRPAKRQVSRALTTRRMAMQLPQPAPYPYPSNPAPGPYAANPYQAPAPYQPQPQAAPPQNFQLAQPIGVVFKPVLRGVAGQYKGTAIAIDATPGILGRDPKLCNMVFTSEADSVSKRHCTVIWDRARGVFVLTDNGSTNGTFLASSERLNPNQPRDLRAGDRFYIGDLRNQFEVALEN